MKWENTCWLEAAWGACTGTIAIWKLTLGCITRIASGGGTRCRARDRAILSPDRYGEKNKGEKREYEAHKILMSLWRFYYV